MGKKLLSLLVYIFISFLSLNSSKVNAQCTDNPSSITISASIQDSSTVCSDASITVNSTITATGGANPSYQWQEKIGSGGWTDITNANSKDLINYTAIQNNSKFRLNITYCQGQNEEQTYNGSSSATLTVNQVKTGSVTISTANTNICPGTTVNFTASPSNQGTSPTYSWRVNGTQQGTAASFSYNNFSNNDQVQLFMTSSTPCVDDFESNILPITLKSAIPDTPAAISGDIVLCPNTNNHTYAIAAVDRATSYQWTLPSGWTGSSTSNSISISVGAVGNGKILKVKAINDCGASSDQTLSINVGPGKPATPSAISNPGLICPGEALSFSVTNDPSVTYTWNVPAGWNIISGQDTNTVNVTAGNYNQNGNITVIASNDCLDSDVRSLAVTVNEPAPNDPGPISGEIIACPNTTVSYTVDAVQYADSYVWYVDNIVQNGQNGATLSFNSGATGTRNLKVIAVNECIDPASYTSISGSTRSISIDDGKPDVITITSNGGNEFCPGDPAVFSIPTDAKADSYNWTVPTGWTITSGQASNTLNVKAGNYNQNGNITATAKSDLCGEVNATFAVSVKKPAPVINSETISGEIDVCASSGGLTYSIPMINNASNYVWSVPTGWNITAGNGTTSIKVSAGTTDGNISVYAENSCGPSSAISLSVTTEDAPPVTLGAISSTKLDTNKNVCPPVTNIPFTVAPISNADSYNWILPDAGWSIASGQGTNSIMVSISSAAVSGTKTVYVEAVNNCGTSNRVAYGNIEIQNHIVTSAGEDITVCKLQSFPNITLTGSAEFGSSKFDPTFTTSGSGTFPNQPTGVRGNFNYTYKPSQADYNLGQVTITVKVPKPTTGNTSGICGTGTGEDSMILTFKPDPTITITAPAEICAGQTANVVFTGTPNTTVTYKIGTGSNQTIQIGDSGSATYTTAALNTNTTYNLVSSQYTAGTGCSKTFTGSATIKVNAVPNVSMSYGNVCTSATTLAPTFTAGSGAWQNGTYTATGALSTIINASTGVFNPSTVTPGTYKVTYSTPVAGGCEKVEITADVSIYEKIVVTSEPVAVQNCEGSDVQFQVGATGDGLTYQWYKNSVAAGNEISGGTNAVLNLSGITSANAGNYLVEIKGILPCTSVVSNSAALIVDENVIISEQPQDLSVCENGTAQITFTATSGGTALNSGYTYQWFKGIPGAGNAVSGAISSTLTFNNASIEDSGDYYVEISGGSGNLCSVKTSDAATLNVRETPSVEVTGTSSICDKEEAELTFTGTPNTVVTYILNGNNTNPLTVAIDASGSVVLNTGKLAATSNANTNYVYSVQSIAYSDDPNCSNTISSEATISVSPDPEAIIAFTDNQVEFCTADTNTHTPGLSGIGAYENGIFSATGLDINPQTGAFVPANNAPNDYIIKYEIPASGGCEAKEVTLDIVVYEKVSITSQPANIGICSTENAEFSITATGDDLAYQWFKDGVLIPGAKAATLLLNVATSKDAGEYYVQVTGTNACTPDGESVVTSDPATLNVDEDIIIIEPATDVKVCADGSTDVTFKFVAHANGAPLNFTWVYANGTPVTISGDYSTELIERNDYEGLNFTVYEGTLTITTVEEADEAEYAVLIDGSDNGFTCPIATSNSFKLDVDPVPTPPIVADVMYCIGENVVALTAEGTNLLWYDSLDDETPSQTAPTPTSDVVGTTTYYVSQTPVYCESELAEIKVIINALPVAPTITNAEIIYCLGATAEQLSVTPDTDHTLNWYTSETSIEKLETAPTPPTAASGDLDYWVSQTNLSECEGPRSSITVKIKELPVISISDDATICEGSSIDLTASDSNTGNTTTFSWNWEGNTGNPLSGSSVTVSPTTTTTYNLTATNEFGCINIDSVTITVDPPTIAGTITAPTSVCISNASGQLILSGYTGEIISWESAPGVIAEGETATWTTLSGTINTQAFSGLTQTTTFRTQVQSGVCEAKYTYASITIDPLPVGGELNFVDGGTNIGRLFMICESAISGYAVPLELSGEAGTVVAWRYRGDSDPTWSIVKNSDGSNFIGTSLIASQIESVVNNETTVFRVEMTSGACSPNKFSQTAIISVIPSDIQPAPVSVDPRTLCLGDTITLNSSTGYGAEYGKFEGGAFDNSSITNKGWRITDKNGNSNYNFSSDADNIRPDKWLRTNPHNFITANINTNATSLQRWDTSLESEGNKGFAIVSGNNTSTLETAVFSLTGIDEAILTFDQAFNLTAGAKIQVEISTNGGSSYSTEPILYSITGPASSGNYDHFGDGTPGVNQMTIDLGNYMGRSNLRIRFNYTGARDGDVWTLDNIKVPEGPQDVQLIWYYDESLENPDNELLQIGEVNQETVQFIPEKIGWNHFEVRTALVFDTNGDPCETAENSETVKVYVYDTYESTATAEVGECGNLNVNLSASITAGTQEGEITEFPEGDGSTVAWEVISAPAGYTFSQNHFLNNDPELSGINDPNAIFQPTMGGSYTLRWKITPKITPVEGEMDLPANPCILNHIDAIFEVIDCTTLDFDGIDDYVDLGNNFTGNYFIETWIRPEASTGSIISGPGFDIQMENLPGITTNGRWYHIAVNNSGKLYVDGNSAGSITINGNGTNKTIIGARWNSTSKTTEHHFSGWIDEMRIWNKELTEKQIRFMMNQRLQLSSKGAGNTVEGEVVPNLSVAGSYYTEGNFNLDQDGVRFYDLTWNDLAGYYRLISNNPDPAGLISFPAEQEPQAGYTPDLSLNGINGRLYNITTDQENTSPTPYLSGQDGAWATDGTWARPTVWDPPNSDGIKWNIARINHNITSEGKDITMLGILSETIDKVLTINADHPIRISHYLLLDGNMDLEGESQLLQDHGSILANSSKGWLEREQQGRQSSYNYNYWSSPVSDQGTDNNSGYTLENVMWDPAAGAKVNFVDGYYSADGGLTSPITISREWIWDFRAGKADLYADWNFLGSQTKEIVAAGYSMKGTTGLVGLSQLQNYAFRGKPNNGDIPTTSLSIAPDQNYLVGNPFPSAMDANEFIRDNLLNVAGGRNTKNVFNGVIYFWDHYANQTHILEEYIGGYAAYTLAGGVEAISNDERITAESGGGGKEPMQYIPVAQGFFLNSVTDPAAATAGINIQGGNIVFNNTQRIYATESNDPSIFLSHETPSKGKAQATAQKDERAKIRINFYSPSGYNRQLLVTRDESTTNGFDLGYDAPLIEDNMEDMYWLVNDQPYVIQAVPDFEDERVLPLAIKTKEGGEFKIEIEKLENWPEGKPVYLRDKLKDSIHAIFTEKYTAQTDAGEIKNRFEIVFFKEAVVDEEPPIVEEPVEEPIGELPIIEGIGVSYSVFDKKVKISNYNKLDVEKVMIFDMGGKLIQEYNNLRSDSEIYLSIRPVRSGIYIVHTLCEEGINIKKIVIK
ncbi:T9SS type A sorting domain-containing protein [Gramella sp. AN32]|uniref:T9SS type A sorting domain-containing protein n=1 Tax=Christiangramia antarctica TaxID=2058158 RepID=A0ABW5X451_9FLAO|nr:T9SS type A sorting domain-containing protein [Gramella sp. AN32]MCM4154808.1 hypothetical protein [Gramella sp. AN32]